MKKNLYFILLALLFSLPKVQSKNAPDRFTLLEDKLHTRQVTSQKAHLPEVGFHISKDLKDFLDRIRNIEEKNSYQSQLSHAQELLRDFNQTEQAISTKVRLDLPLPSFSPGTMQLLPRIEVELRLGGLMSVQQRPLLLREILEYVDNEVPRSIRNSLLNCTTPDPGEDIIKNAVDNNCLRNPALSFAREYLGNYFYPKDPNVPQILVYGKTEARLGPRFHYIYRKRFRGDLKIYWRGRSDIKIRVTDSTLANQNNALDIPDSIHYSDLAADYRFGYRRKNFSGFLAVEEVKLTELHQKENLALALYHDPNPLWRGHFQYRYRLSGSFAAHPYGGIHHRNSYAFSDGIYLGVAWVYQKEYSDILRMKSQLDPEHLTLSASIHHPWLSLSAWLKAPIQEKTGTTRLSSLWGANLTVTL